jgi:hypothetical protein
MRYNNTMKSIVAISILIVTLTLAACSPQTDSIATPVQTTPQSTALATSKPTTAATSTPEAVPVVIIQGEVNLPKTDVDSLRKKVIEPYLEYYKTGSKEQGNLVTLKVEINTNQQSSKDYPYKAEAIFSSGANMGFLVSKNNSTIDWWVPECMGTCPFSPDFKTKYPEIVAKQNGQ